MKKFYTFVFNNKSYFNRKHFFHTIKNKIITPKGVLVVFALCPLNMTRQKTEENFPNRGERCDSRSRGEAQFYILRKKFQDSKQIKWIDK